MNCRDCEESFVESLYGELNGDARGRFDAHLDSCHECARAYAELRSILSVMDERERPEPGQAYWDGFWNRLTARMERDAQRRRSRGWMGRLFPSLSDPGLRWAQRGALAVVLIVFGAIATRMVLPGPGSEQEMGLTPGPEIATPERSQEETVEPSPAMRPASAEVCAHQYIEDSQVLLLALVNFDPETEGEYLGDWSAEKNRSRELVNQAASLKDDLTDPKQRRLRELVTELELIMLQIANLETTADLEAVDLIRSSVEDGDVMLKINLEKMRGSDVAEPKPGECDA
jgi:hypothetical protein